MESLESIIAGGEGHASARVHGAAESPSQTARRLAADGVVLDCETTGFDAKARIWSVALIDLREATFPELAVSPHATTGHPGVCVVSCNPGLLVPNGEDEGQFTWNPRAYDMACQALGGAEPVEYLSQFPAFAEVADQLVNCLVDRDVCGWNIDTFDSRVITRECARVAFAKYSQRLQVIRWWDLMLLYVGWRRELGRELVGDAGAKLARFSLANACADEGIPAETTHLALSGAVCAAQLLRRMGGIA